VQQVVLQFGFEKKFVCDGWLQQQKSCVTLPPPALRTRSKMLHCTLNERSVNFVLNERSVNTAAPRAWRPRAAWPMDRMGNAPGDRQRPTAAPDGSARRQRPTAAPDGSARRQRQSG
jgi:hypothetical protein